jgi:hypothetical protein
VFLFGFGKNDRDNIEDDLLKKLRKIAALWLDADDATLQRGIDHSLITEVKSDGKGKDKSKRQTGR